MRSRDVDVGEYRPITPPVFNLSFLTVGGSIHSLDQSMAVKNSSEIIPWTQFHGHSFWRRDHRSYRRNENEMLLAVGR